MLNKRWYFVDYREYDNKIISSNGFDFSFFRANPKQYLNTWGIYDFDMTHETKDLEVTFGVGSIAEALKIADDFRNTEKVKIGVRYEGADKISTVNAVFDNASWQEYSNGIRLVVKFVCSVISSSQAEYSINLNSSTHPSFTIDAGNVVGDYAIKISVSSGNLRKVQFSVGEFEFSWNASVSANEYFIFDTSNIEASGVVNSSGFLRLKLVDHPSDFKVTNPEQMLIPYTPGKRRIISCDNSQNASGMLILRAGELVI